MGRRIALLQVVLVARCLLGCVRIKEFVILDSDITSKVLLDAEGRFPTKPSEKGEGKNKGKGRKIQTHDEKGRKRGGWYNRCQVVMECVLQDEYGLATELAAAYCNGGPTQDDLAEVA